MHAGHAGVVGNAVGEQRRRSLSQATPQTRRGSLSSGHFSAALDAPLRRPGTRNSIHRSSISQATGQAVWERAEPTDVTQYKTKALAAHKRWVRRNQVEDRRASVLRKAHGGHCSGVAAANVILYVGFGMIGVGMIITFVGLGERGFQTNELKLIGPSLMSAGVVLCILRVCFCTVGASCANRIRRRQSGRELISAEQLSVVRSGRRPETQQSRATTSVRSDSQRTLPPATAGAMGPSPPSPLRDGEASSVPILPPIKVSTATHSGASPGPPPVEVLLDPQTLDRPPSVGSVMSPLAPTRRQVERRPVSTEAGDSDIDELLR